MLQCLPPLLQHSPANSSYLDFFRSNVSSIWSFQGTVNSSSTTCLDDSENKTMSGLSVVLAMVSVNLSCLPRSTFSCQSRAVARSPPAEFLLCGGFSPALTNASERCAGSWCLLTEILVLMVPAITLSTWSWCHR